MRPSHGRDSNAVAGEWAASRKPMTHRAEAPCASGDDLGEVQDGNVRMMRKFLPGKAVRARWRSRWHSNKKPRRKQRLASRPNGWIGRAPCRELSSRQGDVRLFLGWKQTCVKRVLFGRRGVLWQRIEGGQQACTYMPAGSPAWFSVRRWHGIERMAAMNLAAMLLAPPQQ